MHKKILISAGVALILAIGLYLLLRPKKQEHEDLAGETRPIITN